MEDRDMAYYLEDLNRIHELSLEKLGEWKEKYPYCQSVHFLMAKKHQVEGFVEDMSVYHKASFYAVNRQFLQERMTASELEIKNEEAIDEYAEAVADASDDIEFEMNEISDKVEPYLKEINLNENSDKDYTEVSQEIEAQPVFAEESEELSDFAQWVMGLGGPKQSQEGDTSSRKSGKVKKKKKKKSKLERKIEESVIKKDEIITEPLANILAQQGHSEKAIEMYKKLSLIFPEKSSFFALQIEKLNNTK